MESDSSDLEDSCSSEGSFAVSESFWGFWGLADYLIGTGVSAGVSISGWGGPSGCGVSGWSEHSEDLDDFSWGSVNPNALSSLVRVDFLADGLVSHLEESWFDKTATVW